MFSCLFVCFFIIIIILIGSNCWIFSLSYLYHHHHLWLILKIKYPCVICFITFLSWLAFLFCVKKSKKLWKMLFNQSIQQSFYHHYDFNGKFFHHQRQQQQQQRQNSMIKSNSGGNNDNNVKIATTKRIYPCYHCRTLTSSMFMLNHLWHPWRTLSFIIQTLILIGKLFFLFISNNNINIKSMIWSDWFFYFSFDYNFLPISFYP